MKKRALFIIISVMFFSVSSFWAIDNSKVKDELKKYFSSKELEKLVERIKTGDEKNIVIIDVRPTSVYNKSHIPTAINIPNGITNGVFEELKGKNLILYCETGGRVEFAKKNLINDGFNPERMLNFGGFSRYEGKTE